LLLKVIEFSESFEMSVTKSRLYIFDFIRALAVLLVIIGHYLIHHSPYGLNTVFGRLAPIGVGMFFFISGYLIFMTITKSTTKIFLLHRYFRIVPTLVAGIALLAIFNSVFSIKSFLLGVFFIGDAFQEMGVFGIDMWTLHTETRFYLLVALIYPLIIKGYCQSKLRLLLAYGISMAIIILLVFILNNKHSGVHAFDPKWNILCILYLLFGVMYYLYENNSFGLPTLLVVMTINAITIIVAKVLTFGYTFPRACMDNYLLGSFACIGLIMIKDKIPNLKIIALIALISYPLYIIHHPIIYEWGLPGVPIMLFAAFLISFFIEQPIVRWSKKKF